MAANRRRVPPMPAQRPQRRQARETPTQALPANFQVVSYDPIAFWAGDRKDSTPVYFHTIGVKLFDSKAYDKNKPSALLIARADGPAICYEKREGEDEHGPAVQVKTGDIIGIWYKPGMKGLERCHGVGVILDADIGDDGFIKEKDVGKGNPMALYVVRANGRGSLVPVLEDAREHSAHAKVPFIPETLPPRERQRPRRSYGGGANPGFTREPEETEDEQGDDYENEADSRF